MAYDPNLRIELENDVAEVGEAFVCHVSRSAVDGEVNDKGWGQVRSIRLGLRAYTEGRGDTDVKHFANTELPVDEYGMASGRFELVVPLDAPISYDGQLIRVLWEVTAVTDIKAERDQRSSAPLLVLPVGGFGRYSGPHPLHIH